MIRPFIPPPWSSRATHLQGRARGRERGLDRAQLSPPIQCRKTWWICLALMAHARQGRNAKRDDRRHHRPSSLSLDKSNTKRTEDDHLAAPVMAVSASGFCSLSHSSGRNQCPSRAFVIRWWMTRLFEIIKRISLVCQNTKTKSLSNWFRLDSSEALFFAITAPLNCTTCGTCTKHLTSEEKSGLDDKQKETDYILDLSTVGSRPTSVPSL